MSHGFRAMDVTKPYEFIGFGAMAVTKPYEFIGFGAASAPEASSACVLGASSSTESLRRRGRPRGGVFGPHRLPNLGRTYGRILDFCFWDLGPLSGQTWPQDPFNRVQLEIWCRTHPKLAPELNFDAISWRFCVRTSKLKSRF